jgi:hypothetical protein
LLSIEKVWLMLCYIFPSSTSKVCHYLNYTFFKRQTKIIFTKKKIAIEDHIFFGFVYQGELLGDTLKQASLSMHQSLFRLGVAAMELALASLYEDPKSQVLLQLESQ